MAFSAVSIAQSFCFIRSWSLPGCSRLTADGLPWMMRTEGPPEYGESRLGMAARKASKRSLLSVAMYPLKLPESQYCAT